MQEMVQEALWNLKEPGGSSLHSIKQYVTTKYNFEAETLTPGGDFLDLCDQKIHINMCPILAGYGVMTA
jgi:hypothetical protein